MLLNTTSSPQMKKLFYSGAVIYQNDVVATIALAFYNFKIRLWNYYSNFSSTGLVQVRLSVYDPAFYMPSLMTLNLQINFPPNGCQLSVTPTSGTAYDTNFTILFDNCYDEDAPLSYRFQYYLSKEQMDADIVSGVAININTLTDYIPDSEFMTWLPQGDTIIDD
jgi:hypothetical protein